MIDLLAIRAALEDAIDAGRENPERDQGVIASELMKALGAKHGQDAESFKTAKERLAMAAQRNDALEDYNGAAIVDAVIGVGHAILAMGADAEVFFSMFANGEATVTTHNGGDV